MFHAGGHKGINTRGRSTALSRHYPHFLSHVDWKAPLRCGILFCTFSSILFVIGIILTWLGVHDMFGESVPITGPILLAVGGLMLILALRQFCMAHVRKKAHTEALQGKKLGVTAIVAIVEQDEEQDLTDAEVDPQKVGMGTCMNSEDMSETNQLTPGGYCDSSTLSSSCGDTLSNEGYVWRPAPLQHPYYSMAMMAYKDPSLFYSSCISAPMSADSYGVGSVYVANTNMIGFELGDETGAISSGSHSLSPLLHQKDSAVLHTSSITLQKSPSSSSSPTSDCGQRMESSKIFPADYLTPYQRSSGVSNTANAGISNLPNTTAFMMLRTLELQETI